MARILGFLLLAVWGVADAQPSSLLATDFFACFTRVDPNSNAVQISKVPADHPEFSSALRIRTVSTTPNPWDTRVRCFDTLAASRNDTILVTFWMRTTASPTGTGSTEFVLEKGANPWTKSGDKTVTAGAEWKKFEIPFSMLEDYGDARTSAGGSTYNLSFWVDFPRQEIEIGGFSILDYHATSFWDLGLENWPYEGHAADAPWRAEAAQRIEKYRKADIAVLVRDEAGNPVANAPVKVKMKRHAFGFGTAVDGARLSEQSENGDKYRAKILQMFNKAVLENNLKWPFWDTRNQATCGEGWGRAAAEPALKWLRDNGITDIRGHNLIWPGKSNLPCDVVNILNATPVDKAALRQRIHDHFVEIMDATRGELTEWDVINEPYANHDVQDVLGNSEMVEWFKLARQLDPAPKLFLNEYNIVSAGGSDQPHQDGVYNILKSLIDNGAPVDGIGVQSHFGMNLTPPERVWEILDRFATLGKPIEVTEFDVDVTDQRLQADYTRDFLTAVFAHPSVSGFLMWGFWAGQHWNPDAALINQDWSTKPNYDVWIDLTQHQWWTDVEGTTGADGVFRTRGFLGDYEIDAGGQTLPLTVNRGQVNYAVAGSVPAGSFTGGGVVNAASFKTGPVAPGEIVEIWGTDFGATNATLGSYADGQLPSFGGDTRVLFDGIAAPLIHTMRWDQDPHVGRVAVVVPYSVSGSTSVEVEYLGTRSAPVALQVADSAPGIFCWNDGTPLAVAVTHNPDGTTALNRDTPVERGGYIEFYITGEGQTEPAGVDGRLPVFPDNPRPALPVEVTIGGIKSEDVYNWTGQIFSGVLQVNARVPDGIQPGNDVPLEVSVGGVSAQDGVTIRVQ